MVYTLCANMDVLTILKPAYFLSQIFGLTYCKIPKKRYAKFEKSRILLFWCCFLFIGDLALKMITFDVFLKSVAHKKADNKIFIITAISIKILIVNVTKITETVLMLLSAPLLCETIEKLNTICILMIFFNFIKFGRDFKRLLMSISFFIIFIIAIFVAVGWRYSMQKNIWEFISLLLTRSTSMVIFINFIMLATVIYLPLRSINVVILKRLFLGNPLAVRWLFICDDLLKDVIDNANSIFALVNYIEVLTIFFEFIYSVPAQMQRDSDDSLLNVILLFTLRSAQIFFITAVSTFVRSEVCNFGVENFEPKLFKGFKNLSSIKNHIFKN